MKNMQLFDYRYLQDKTILYVALDLKESKLSPGRSIVSGNGGSNDKQNFTICGPLYWPLSTTVKVVYKGLHPHDQHS